jgi:starvation-inducible outer membrane lipoprotein
MAKALILAALLLTGCATRPIRMDGNWEPNDGWGRRTAQLEPSRPALLTARTAF